ncbi:winged helix-turn-helix domain-containing protein [Streptomyces boninensis]|uniref:winged helix-turn-helix domain-containing protein n=1 Tax=Streptomyces boninensis TaxID=2039455 RepID=UPI003B225508
MLRVHFTAGDLARTRIADGPDPLWETVLSVQQLGERRPDPVLAAWREGGCPRGRAALRALRPLMPTRGYFPDFLTPAASSAGFEHGVEAVLGTPRRRLRAEIGRVAAASPLPAWTRELADGEAGGMRRLGQALGTYHDSALAPAWRRIAARTEEDRVRRAQAQSTAGTEAMLRTFAPALRYAAPVLTADYPVERDLHLRGRGLLLVPSYFCRRTPVVLADEELPPVLVYPARADGSGQGSSPTLPAELTALLGHTRAVVLHSLREPCSNADLASRAGVAPSSASEHAAVLRRAGLVVTTRQRNRVHHALTPLGTALLTGPAAPALTAPGPVPGHGAA